MALLTTAAAITKSQDPIKRTSRETSKAHTAVVFCDGRRKHYTNLGNSLKTILKAAEIWTHRCP